MRQRRSGRDLASPIGEIPLGVFRTPVLDEFPV